MDVHTRETDHGAHPAADHAATAAERAWLAGDVVTAIAAADRALGAGTDPGSRAAGVAAAAAAADGALRDAAARWRAVAATQDGTPAVEALGRAALAAALAGDVVAASGDVEQACGRMPDPAPRGLGVLVAGAAATLDALRGDVTGAARTLTGLAAATVPPDPLAAESWDELAAVVVAAAGQEATARAMLAAVPGEPTVRRRLLTAWTDLRGARLREAHEGLAAARATPVLRRNAVLAAAVGTGLARRAATTPEGAATLAATWHRAAAVVAGADVEPLLIDVWGELSVAAAHVSPTDRDSLTEAIATAVARAGHPPWLVAADAWWRVERAVVTRDRAAADDAAAVLTALADRSVAGRSPEGGRTPAHAPDRFALLAGAATAWTAVLAARPDAGTVVAVADRLTGAGRRVEASALCAAAAEVSTDPAAVRALLGTGRELRTSGGTATGLLSEREQEVGALVVDGLTQKEIGARLYISPKTVEQHVARLRRKLSARNRAELVAALRTHLPA
ncbi:MAG: LuxR C-terminal-related transcriptional regulator [Pseudonocardia sp.]